MKVLRYLIYLLILFGTMVLCQLDVLAQDNHVLTGIDVLEAEHFSPLIGKNVGLITNQTGMDRHWHSTIDILYHVKGVHLIALSSPEHGIRGITDTKVSELAQMFNRESKRVSTWRLLE